MNNAVISATEKQYASCLALYARWGGQLPTSKGQIIAFFQDVAAIQRVDRKKVASLRVYRAALSDWHERHWDEDPASHKDIKRCLSDLARQERGQRIFQDKSRDLTVEEGARFIALLTVKYGSKVAIRNRALACIAYLTGYRAGMLGDLQYDWLRNVQLEGADIIIDRDPFKTGKRVRSVIPFTGELFCPASWLRQHLQTNQITQGFIFRETSALGKMAAGKAPFHRNSVNIILKSLMQEAKIEGGKLTAHTFRKTMATLGVMNNVSSVEIAAQGGWMDVSTVNNHYVNDAISMLGRAPLALVQATNVAARKIERFADDERVAIDNHHE
ncbi:MAG: tyrosine-type recombinase/integrase [Bermanella sp.]